MDYCIEHLKLVQTLFLGGSTYQQMCFFLEHLDGRDGDGVVYWGL